jgi:uncharacterized protein with GYD domain
VGWGATTSRASTTPPDDQTLTTALLPTAGAGNLRTETLRAFTAEEMSDIVRQLG